MRDYLVWDESMEPEDAKPFRASGPKEAALSFAERDTDGFVDGSYTGYRGRELQDLLRAGHVVRVRDPDGNVTRWRVGVIEFEPLFGAEQESDESD